MKRVSTKTAARNRRYARERLVFLAAHPFCGAHLSGCTITATEVHHKAGRLPSVFFQQAAWAALCSKCHQWVTANPAEARERGLSLHRGAA